MKIVRIFGIVLALHVVGGILVIQSGCQSQPHPRAAETQPATGEPSDQLDWENWDDADALATTDRPRSEPTRPVSQPSATTSENESVLEPLSSDFEPFPTTAPDEVEETTSYTVRKGDSLWVIANRNHVSLGALLSANGLTKNSVIQPGQTLQIPGGSSSPSPDSTSAAFPEGTTTYTVRSGDNLSSIALRFGTTVPDLKALNNMSSDVIRIDQELIVPEGGARDVTASRSSSGVSSASSASGKRHVVKAGETPGGIAIRYGISVKELMSANNISDPRRMRLGQELIIPGASGSNEESASDSSESNPGPETGPASEPTPVPEPAEAPVPQDIPVIPMESIEDEESEEQYFPIIPIVPSEE